MLKRKNLVSIDSANGFSWGLCALAALTLGTQAFAAPHHIAVKTDNVASTESDCVFPDGSNPAGQPELHCVTPAQFMAAYGIDKLHAMGLTGKGQVIILADSYGSPTMQADLDHFSDTFGLPRTKIQFIYPNGTYVNPMATEDEVGWAGETTLDLEWAHAVAPDATLVNIVTSSSETVGMAGMQDLFNGIATATKEYPNAIISMSFGTGETTFSAAEQKTYLLGSLHQILQQATDAGITLLASAGDQGSANMNAANTGLSPYPDASYPATDPLITAVGGTAVEAGWTWTPQGTADDFWNCVASGVEKCQNDFLLSVNTPGSLIETVWKEDWAPAAGGGGVSSVFTQPDFQAELNANVQKVANGHRAIPDISMNAAINGGVETYQSSGSGGQAASAPWQVVGGTSCASPETAGLIALAGQEASTLLGKQVGIGSLNSYLYKLGAQDFNDVVSHSFGAANQVVIDNNAYYFSQAALSLLGPKQMTPQAVSGFFTMPGYDMASGLGSPHAENFVLDLAKARAASEEVGPVSPSILSER